MVSSKTTLITGTYSLFNDVLKPVILIRELKSSFAPISLINKQNLIYGFKPGFSVALSGCENRKHRNAA